MCLEKKGRKYDAFYASSSLSVFLFTVDPLLFFGPDTVIELAAEKSLSPSQFFSSIQSY